MSAAKLIDRLVRRAEDSAYAEHVAERREVLVAMIEAAGDMIADDRDTLLADTLAMVQRLEDGDGGPPATPSEVAALLRELVSEAGLLRGLVNASRAL